MLKKIIKYFQKASIKNISVEVNENKLVLKLDNLSLNKLNQPDLIIRKLIIGEGGKKGGRESSSLPFSFEGLDISISQHFITSALNIALSGFNLVDYLKFNIKSSKLILKGALKKYITFPFYMELDINQLENFLCCIEFKSIWLIDILPVPTFTLKNLFNFLNKKINLPFIAFENNKIFLDFGKIEFFKTNRLVLKKISFSEGFINLVIDIEI